MQKSKTIKIDDRKVTVKELRVKDIRSLMETAEKAEEDDFLKLAEPLLPLAVDIKAEDLEEMAPSELKLLWEAFKEVNADFLSVIERLGIGEALSGLIRQHLTDALADLSNGDTETSGDTDGDSS